MKKFLAIFCTGCMMLCFLYAAFDLGKMDVTYDPSKVTTPVYELQQDPESYDDSMADGAAAAIVQQNLSGTHALNDVTSIVFDFRGYDTMGEAFILVTAVTGAAVILSVGTKKKEDEGDER